jgi:hypothetical protein
MVRRAAAPALVLVVALAVLAAGCGGSSAPYTADGTAKCLEKKGFTEVTTVPEKVGVIAGFAENGGLRAKAPNGNVVTIAFAQDAAGAGATEDAFKAHASPFYKSHIADVMESQRNAVLVWTTAPSELQLSTALGCLH